MTAKFEVIAVVLGTFVIATYAYISGMTAESENRRRTENWRKTYNLECGIEKLSERIEVLESKRN